MINKIFTGIFFLYLGTYPLIPSGIFNKYHLGDILIGLFIFSFILKSLYCKRERSIFIERVKDIIKDPIFLTAMAAVLIMIISMTYAVDKNISLMESFRFLTYIILYIAIKYEFNIRDNFTKYQFIVSVQSFIIFFYGIIQYFTGIGVKVDTNGTMRMESTLGYPTAFAAYIVVVIFPLIMFFIKSKNRNYRVFCGINLILALFTLVVSYSRNGWLALLVGLVVLAIIFNYKFLYAIGVSAVVALVIPFIRVRVLQLGSMAINGGRIKLWKIAFKMIEEHPIRGIGAGNYVTLVNDYFIKYPELYEVGHEGFPTHNSYLKLWSETGIIGFLIFFSTYVIMGIKLFISNLKYKNRFLGLTTGVMASFFAFLFINLFDNMMFTPKVMTIFFALSSLCITIDSREIN